jgi:hypothetical protein
VRLDDLVIFFRLLFARILSGEDANASPYSRYYIAANNPIAWKHIATVVATTLKRMGKWEDSTTQSISVSKLEPPCAFFEVFLNRTRA